MKNRCKLLSLLLAACLVAVGMASCSGNNTQKPNATTQATTLSPEEKPAPPVQETDYEKTVSEAFASAMEPSADQFLYETSNRGVTLTGYVGEQTRVVVPAEIEGAPVIAVADGAFANQTELTVLILPQGLQSIGEGILKGCTSLRALKTGLMGTDARSEQYLGYLFGADTYENNSRDVPVSLEILELWQGLAVLPAFALYDCNDLVAVRLPETLTSLEEYSMFRCERLQYVNVSHLIFVGAHALDSCKSLEHLALGASLESIALGALEGCSGLRSLTLPFVGESANENTYLGYIFGAEVPEFSAGYYPQRLIEIKLLSTCRALGNYAFYECNRLVYLTMEEGIVSIGTRAFDGCERLREITVPNSVQHIGDNAFFGCLRLERVIFGDPAASALELIGVNAFYDCVSLDQVVLPQKLSFLPASCFANCRSLTQIDLGGVESVGKNAFRGCDALTSVSSKDGVRFEEGNGAATQKAN